MKALKILKIIYKDCKDWNDKGFQTEYSADVLLEAIEELQELNKKLEASKEYFDLKLKGTFNE